MNTESTISGSSKHNDKDYETAAEWFDTFCDGPVDASVKMQFNEWLEGAPERRKIYHAIAGTWQNEALAIAVSLVEDAEQKCKPISAVDQPGIWDKYWMKGGIGVAAAALLIVIVMSALPTPPPTVANFSTATAERSEFKLTDGTNIQANASTKLKVELGQDYRSVVLNQGEAFFDVASNKDKPFTVKAGLAKVTVVGTQFNVDRLSTHVEVAVFEGKVTVSSHILGKTLELLPGQRASIDRTNIKKMPSFTSEKFVDWRDDWLQASGVPLVDIVEKLKRYSKKTISISGKNTENARVSGRFRLSKVEDTLTMIAATHGLKIKTDPEAIVLSL